MKPTLSKSHSESVGPTSTDLPPTPVSPTFVGPPREQQPCPVKLNNDQDSLQNSSDSAHADPKPIGNDVAPQVQLPRSSPSDMTPVVTPAIKLSVDTYPVLVSFQRPCANGSPAHCENQRAPDLCTEGSTGVRNTSPAQYNNRQIPESLSPPNLRPHTSHQVPTHRPIVVLVPMELRARQVEPRFARLPPYALPTSSPATPPMPGNQPVYRSDSKSASSEDKKQPVAGPSFNQTPPVHPPWDRCVAISVPYMCGPNNITAYATKCSPPSFAQREATSYSRFGSFLQSELLNATPETSHTAPECRPSFVQDCQESAVARPQSSELGSMLFPQIPIIAVKPSVSSSKLRRRESHSQASSTVPVLNEAETAPKECDSRTRRFKCERCPRAFFRKSDLSRHEHIHTGVKPNACHICHKRFIQRSALGVHIRVHTGEKPHSCPFCDRRFSDSSSLARHRRIHLRNARIKGISAEVALATALAQQESRRAEKAGRITNVQKEIKSANRTTVGLMEDQPCKSQPSLSKV